VLPPLPADDPRGHAGEARGGRGREADDAIAFAGTNSVISALCVPASSRAFSSSGENMTYWSFANSYPLAMSSRATGTSSFTQKYCCLSREPHVLCRRLNDIARPASVAE
jgi:hypothetical protein